jgi:hypothetical protein
MVPRQPESRSELAEQLKESPFLSDFVLPFPDLMAGGGGLSRSFERIADSVGATKAQGLIRVSIREGDGLRSWWLELSPDGCRVVEARRESPTLELLTQADVWSQVASGELTPLEAFVMGKLRVRGDLRIARIFVRKLRDASPAPFDDDVEDETSG